jgi:hypothetical protein
MAEATARPAPDQNERLSDLEAFRISCLKDAIYHEDRERFYAWLHRAGMFVVIVGGAATVASVMASWTDVIGWIGLVVFLVGTLDLVFDIDGKARRHSILRRRAFELLADAEKASPDLHDLKARRAVGYADEPPCLYAANALAFNAALAAYGRPSGQSFKVGWLPARLRHIIAFTPATFRTLDERAAAKAGASI